MKTVHAKDVSSPAMCYMKIPQPMYVYHTPRELEEHVEKPAVILNDFADYHRFMVQNDIDLNYNSDNKYVDLVGYNLWIKTVDKLIPECTDFSGKIYYKKGDIPTSGCYIRLYYITPTPTRHILFTSSGVHTIGMTKWDMTAGIRFNYSQEKDPRQAKTPEGKEKFYQENLQKILRRKKPTVPMTRIINMMLNRDSNCFLDFDKACSIVYKSNAVKAPDRHKLLETKQFKDVFMATIKSLFPDLAPAIREKHSPEQMAEMLAEIYAIAKEDKNVDRMLKVFDKVKEVGYEEDTVVNDFTGVPTLGVGPQAPALPAAVTTDEFLGEPDREVKSSGNDLTETDYDKLRDEADALPSFVIPSREEVEKTLDND